MGRKRTIHSGLPSPRSVTQSGILQAEPSPTFPLDKYNTYHVNGITPKITTFARGTNSTSIRARTTLSRALSTHITLRLLPTAGWNTRPQVLIPILIVRRYQKCLPNAVGQRAITRHCIMNWSRVKRGDNRIPLLGHLPSTSRVSG